MSQHLPSSKRYNLLRPYERCKCSVCEAGATAHTNENAVAPFRMGLKIPSVRSHLLVEVHDWTLFEKDSNFNLKRDATRVSILDLADETIEQIFDEARDTHSSICLALSCKRLYTIFGTTRNEKEEARRWNNVSGPWKQGLMLSLACGYIPKDTMKLCFGCWRFVPFGKSSKPVWERLVNDTGCAKSKILWELNWEVALFIKGKRLEEIIDNRIRCPLCVFYDQDVLLTSTYYYDGASYGRPLKSFPQKNVVKAPQKAPRYRKPMRDKNATTWQAGWKYTNDGWLIGPSKDGW